MRRTGKRWWALGLLWLFVAGMIFMPVRHHLQLSQADDYHADGGCCHAHRGGGHAGCAHRNESDNESSDRQHRHDPSTCAICQLAKAPVDTAVVAVDIPPCEAAAEAAETIFSSPVFTAPSLLPFSRGPPA